MADNVDENGNAEVPAYLKLRVIGSGDGSEVHFRIKHTTSMSKLKKSYAERVGVSASTISFVYNKRRIDDGDTPQSLGMKEGDAIIVYPVVSSSMCQACVAHFTREDEGDSGEEEES